MQQVGILQGGRHLGAGCLREECLPAGGCLRVGDCLQVGECLPVGRLQEAATLLQVDSMAPLAARPWELLRAVRQPPPRRAVTSRRHARAAVASNSKNVGSTCIQVS